MEYDQISVVVALIREVQHTVLLKIDELSQFLKMKVSGEAGRGSRRDETGEWIDSQEVRLLLHISKRKLQSMRDKGEIAYSSNGKRKYYYKRTDVEAMLEKNYHRPDIPELRDNPYL